MESKEQEAENAKEEYEACRQSPETLDLLGDDCKTYSREYKDAKEELDTAVSNMESEVDNVEDAHSKVLSKCTSGAARSGDAVFLCSVYRQARGEYSEADLMRACMKKLSEAACRACLSTK